MNIIKFLDIRLEMLKDLKLPIQNSQEIYEEFKDSEELETYLSNTSHEHIFPITYPIYINTYIQMFKLMKFKASKNRVKLSLIIDMIDKLYDIIEKFKPEVRIIGISGKMGSGKSLVSRIIYESFHKFTERSFAENIRKIASILSGVNINDTRTVKQKNIYLEEWDKTIGQLL